MRTYVGIKKLNARPCTLGDYNKIREWTIPENEDPNKEGYLVEYADGYISWSPKETFEEAYTECGDIEYDTLAATALGMVSNDFKERFRAEYAQIIIRRNGLAKLLVGMNIGALNFTPKCSYELLLNQFIEMDNMIIILERRAEIEHISLRNLPENNESVKTLHQKF